MKLPLKWLADYIDPGLEPKALAQRLTMAGLEAEKIERIGEMWGDHVFVGYVTSVERHPDADRLVLASVEAGEHRLTVVTGAPNIAQGQKVALALSGARLYDGHKEGQVLMTLKPGTIRGVRSEGMVCSEKELGLSEEHEGILVLSEDAPVGDRLMDYLGDTVIELEITPNLVHAFSVLGVAREVHALTGNPLSQPEVADVGAYPSPSANLVENQAPERCFRFLAVEFRNVTIGPSPEWMVRRLEAAGMRAINNVVDVTNYVMHELGQPMHAYDHDKLAGRRLIVRRADDGEKLITLDHVERSLDPSMTVIADERHVVGVAGIIGGLNTEVDDASTHILLEVANWEMKSTRQTARTFRVRTEAGARNERGLDPELAGIATARATKLLLAVCPGAHVVAVQDVYPSPEPRRTISFDRHCVESLLGTPFDDKEIHAILTRLDFEPSLTSESISVTVPSYRRDVLYRQDVIEEIARIAGYERIPATLPSVQTLPVRQAPEDRLRRFVRQTLVSAGFSEAVTYVTVGDTELERFSNGEQVGLLHRVPRGDLVRLRNPMQAERGVLRPSLVPSLLEAAASNLKHAHSVRLTELAHVFLPEGDGPLPREVETCAMVLAGRRETFGRFGVEGELDFYDAKGAVTAIIERAGVRGATVRAVNVPGLQPGRAAEVLLGDVEVAIVGEVHPGVARAFGIEDHRVAVAELDLERLLSAMPADRREVTVPRALPLEQDYAIVVPHETSAGDVESALRSAAGALVTDVTLFDVFSGPQIGEGNKSLAFRVVYAAPDRTLTDDDVAKLRPRIEKTLKQRVGGALRV